MLIQGDNNVSFPFNTGKDLTGTTVKVDIMKSDGKVNKVANILDAKKGKCEVILLSTDLTVGGKYSYQWTIEYEDGKKVSSLSTIFNVGWKLGLEPIPDNGNNGNVGVGLPGKSAYQIWLDAGNTGTEQDFLNSLIGPQGPQGPAGTGGGGTSLTFRDITAGELFSMTTPPPITTVYGNIVINKTAETINEGTTTSFTVTLDKAPTDNQVISLSVNNSDVTLDKTSLTFTSANYNVAQTVNVTIANDTDMSNESAIITLSNPNVTSKTLTLTITDTTVGTPVAATSISLDKSTSALNVGSSEQLIATVSPSNASNKNVIWSSSNTAIATVSSGGLVTAVAQGSATITAKSEDGNYTASCVYTVAVSNFAGAQKAYVQGSYLYVDPSTILDTDISIRAEGEASHKYFSMGVFLNTINLALGTATTANASNVFNGVIPYAGEQTLANFTAGSLSVPDTCYITYNGAIYVRIPASIYTNNGNSIPLALAAISQRLPVLKGTANDEFIITDTTIDAVTTISAITVTNNMWTGFLTLPSGLGTYTSIVNGVNSISGRYTSSITTREMWYVNATTRLNFKIPQDKMASCTLATVKQYLKDNRLTLWVAK
jgi:5-hydroxyisourate hydrolase-like protein (transthyretin family)